MSNLESNSFLNEAFICSDKDDPHFDFIPQTPLLPKRSKEILNENFIDPEIIEKTFEKSKSTFASKIFQFVIIPLLYFIGITFAVLVIFLIIEELNYIRFPNLKFKKNITKRKELTNIIKPLSDKKNYRFLELNNSLKVMLISDPEAIKGGAALSVDVGSSYEPKNLDGIAHLLEHMLFLGSKTYPDDKYFKNFLSHYDGKTNAYTTDDSTNFFFEVNTPYLEKSLEIFSHFFIDPLLDPSAIDREINAVNSEYEKDLQVNAWRFQELLRRLSNPEHSYYKFTIGNLHTLKEIPESLGIDMHKELVNFHKNYYSSDKMTLVIQGDQSLDEMEVWASKYFSIVPKNLAFKVPETKNISAFNSSSLGKVVWYKPIGKVRTLSYVFPIEQKTKISGLILPLKFISFLLTNRMKGSLHLHLKNKGWITSMEAYSSKKAKDFTNFVVNMKLTEDGLINAMEITEIFFSYIKKLRSEEISESLYKELSLISYLQFMYKERDVTSSSILELVGKVSGNIDEMLIKGNVFMKFDKDIIGSYLSKIEAKNGFIIIGSEKMETAQVFETLRYKTIEEIIASNIHRLKNSHTLHFLEVSETFEKIVKDNPEESFYADECILDCEHQDSNEPILSENLEFKKVLNQKVLPLKTDYDYFERSKFKDNQNFLFNERKFLDKYDSKMKFFFTIEPLPKDIVERLQNGNYNKSSEFTRPSSNRFLPENLEMITECKEDNHQKSNKSMIRKVFRTNSFAKSISDLIENKLKIDNQDLKSSLCYQRELNIDIESDEPKLIMKDDDKEIWVKTDRVYNLPKTTSIFLLKTGDGFTSANEFLKSKLLSIFIQNSITDDMYDASYMGYKSKIVTTHKGFYLVFSGFSDKLESIMKISMDKFSNTTFSKKSFEYLIDSIKRSLENLSKEQQYKQGIQMLKKAFDSNYFTNEELLDSIKNINHTNLISFYDDIKKKVSLTALYVGNVDDIHAEKLTKSAFTSLRTTINSHEKKINISIPLLPPNTHLLYSLESKNTDDNNNLLLECYQLGKRNLTEYLAMKYFLDPLRSEAFSYLRTKNQLGYFVSTNLFTNHQIDSVVFIVQGSSKSPIEMEFYTNNLVKEFYQVLKNKTIKDFGQNEEILNAKILDGSLDSKAYRLWVDIEEETYEFRNSEKLKEIRKNMKMEDILSVYSKLFLENPRKFVIHIGKGNSTNHTASDGEYIKIDSLDKVKEFFIFE